MSVSHRIGVVGVGNWGRYIVRDLVSLGCAVVAIARSEASRRRAEEGGATTIVATVEEMPEVDGIVIATPSTDHTRQIRAVLPRCVPVFVEKPMTTDLDAARRLVDEAGERLFVMHKWRYHPGVEMLGEIARRGELGVVEGLRLTQIGWGNPHHDCDIVWHLVPHCLSLAIGVLGSLPDPMSAVASVGDDGYALDMMALLGPRPTVSLHVSARSPEKIRVFTLVGRDGVATLDGGYTDHVTIAREDSTNPDAPVVERRSISTEMPLLRELRDFVSHVGGGPPPRCSAMEGLEVVAAIDTLRRQAGLDTPQRVS